MGGRAGPLVKDLGLRDRAHHRDIIGIHEG